MSDNERIVISIDTTRSEQLLDALQQKIDKLNASLSATASTAASTASNVNPGISGAAATAGVAGASMGAASILSPSAAARIASRARINPNSIARLHSRWSPANQATQEEKDRIRAEKEAARAEAKAAKAAKKAAEEEEKETARIAAAKKIAQQKIMRGFGLVAAGGGAGILGGMAGSPAGTWGGIGTAIAGGGMAIGNAGRWLSAKYGDSSFFTSIQLLGATLPLVGATAGFMGLVGGQRYSLANQIADTEKAGLFAGLAGGGSVIAGRKPDTGPVGGTPDNPLFETITSQTKSKMARVSAWTRLGMGPTEAAQQQSMAALAAGYNGSMRGVSIPTAISRGVSAGALGNLAGAVGMGSGGSGATLTTGVIAAGVRQGFSGSRLERWMALATNAIERSAMMGVKLNTDNYARMLHGMSKAAPGSGMAAANVMSNIAVLPGQVKQSITGQFASVAQALVLAKAAKSGGGLGGLLGGLENMSPQDVMGAIAGGGIAGQAYLSSFTQFDTAGQFMKAVPTKGSMPIGGKSASVGEAARVRAESQFRLQQTMSAQQAADFIRAVTDLQITIHDAVDKIGFDNFFVKLTEVLKDLIKYL